MSKDANKLPDQPAATMNFIQAELRAAVTATAAAAADDAARVAHSIQSIPFFLLAGQMGILTAARNLNGIRRGETILFIVKK